MPLTLGVVRETAPGETRVALAPETAARLVKDGFAVVVASGAGAGAFHADADYAQAGCTTGDPYGADVLLCVSAPNPERLRADQVAVGLLDPLGSPQTVQRLAQTGATLLAMELVPRTSRAQKMDALSALSSLAGYRAALIAATRLPKFFPLLTTAAGTLRPAQVLVLGAGVAGLQAIATARRLGARVSAYDVRAAAAEEVRSLGALFVELDLDAGDQQDAGGYARALADEQAERQVRALATHIAKADAVITTALIPGRRAPLLVSADAVAAMQPGSVVVDLAAPGGGNCALTQAGETVVTPHGVSVVGPANIGAEMPVHASLVYGRTLAALVAHVATADGLALDLDDDIVQGALVARSGQVVHPRVSALLQAA